MDQRIHRFVLNCHLTPQGIVGLDKPGKKPRPIFDSSFHPCPDSFAINDWTNKANEPELTFMGAFESLLRWIYNCRISYPHEEILLGDDDISGAFRHCKYNPQVVAMHCCRIRDILVAYTGMTFGDNTSPSNWDVVARVRCQVARARWHEPDVVARAAPYLPSIRFPVSAGSTLAFARADADSINQGVFDASGKRLPPPYKPFVDDTGYADVTSLMSRTVSASIIAAFDLLGYPTDSFPCPVSMDKLNTEYSHVREFLGWGIDSRQMRVFLLERKRADIIGLLDDWLRVHSETFDLRAAATLHGSLGAISTYCRWARPLFLAIRNALSETLTVRYHVLERAQKREKAQKLLARALPPSLAHRILGLVSRHIARLLWSSRTTVGTPASSSSLFATGAADGNPLPSFVFALTFHIPCFTGTMYRSYAVCCLYLGSWVTND